MYLIFFDCFKYYNTSYKLIDCQTSPPNYNPNYTNNYTNNSFINANGTNNNNNNSNNSNNNNTNVIDANINNKSNIAFNNFNNPYNSFNSFNKEKYNKLEYYTDLNMYIHNVYVLNDNNSEYRPYNKHVVLNLVDNNNLENQKKNS